MQLERLCTFHLGGHRILSFLLPSRQCPFPFLLDCWSLKGSAEGQWGAGTLLPVLISGETVCLLL